MALANKDSYYKGKPLGSIGHFSCISFHETKNIQCGEGGMLVINDDRFLRRSEIIWEKGTNRSAFWRGEVDKYGWTDIGSSFLPSEITAAFLYAQLENLDDIQAKRKSLWDRYFKESEILKGKGISVPTFPEYCTNNAHMFYLVCSTLEQRSKIINELKENGILAVFHYLSLHRSPFYQSKHDGRELPQSDRYSDCLVRFPLFYELGEKDLELIIMILKKYLEEN